MERLEDDELEEGKLLATDVKEDFFKDDRGQKVKRTIKTFKYEIRNNDSTIIRTVKKSRLR